MRESLLYSALRAFLLSLCSIIGICLGFLLILALFSSFESKESEKLKINTDYKPQIAPNAAGERKELSKTAPVILKVNIHGLIGSDDLNMRTVAQLLQESREGVMKNGRVKALLVHINSPGGTVIDASGIYSALIQYKEQYKVPVYGFVDGICASGGLYIAAACDKLLATPSSIIGSVGVLMPTFFNATKLLDKVGLEAMTLTAGKGKDSLNPFRIWKEGEEDNIQHIIDDYYNQFVDIVAKGRPGLNKEKLVENYGAKIFVAAKAQEIGFVDGADASEGEALKELAQKIGIDDDYYQVVEMSKKNWLTEFITSKSSLLTGTLQHKIVLPYELPPEMTGQWLYLYRQVRHCE